MARLTYTETTTPTGHKTLHADDGKTHYTYDLGHYSVFVTDAYGIGTSIPLAKPSKTLAKAAIRAHAKENN